MQDSTIVTNIRRKEIIKLAANKAIELPILPSGYWFHQDLRDNFYYAIHLFAYCVDKEFECDWNEEQCEKAKGIALTMIRNVLSLQEVNSHDQMYGHWPLNLGDNPLEAKTNLLPVELMGCLLVLFYNKYHHELSPTIKNNCYQAIAHIYESDVYRHPLKNMHHHEAKHTSLKLLLGDFFKNDELVEQGLRLAKKQLNHLRSFGFKEYGAHPWFWHWVQSFTCVWETVENTDVKSTTSDLLDYLWRLRSEYYLKGTWVGPHSRQLRHDSPKDRNTLLDYIQFGDFSVPTEIVRLEGSALFTYEVSDNIVQAAIKRAQPVEVKRKIQFAYADDIVTSEAHTYVFITPDYAIGGIWERIREFDNEQKRWDITLPLAHSDSANQAFFFHPGEKYAAGDDRHASSFGEVMYHKDTVIQLWNVPADHNDAFPAIIGCLPKGEWKFEKDRGYGKVEDTFITFQLMNECNWEEKKDRISISSPLMSNWNGVVMEIISFKDAAELGIIDLDSFCRVMGDKNKSCFTSEDTFGKMTASYMTWRNESVQFSLDNQGNLNRLLNGRELSLGDYPINKCNRTVFEERR